MEASSKKTHQVTKIISKGRKHFRIKARTLEVHDYNLVKSRPTHALGMVMYRWGLIANGFCLRLHRQNWLCHIRLGAIIRCDYPQLLSTVSCNESHDNISWPDFMVAYGQKNKHIDVYLHSFLDTKQFLGFTSL